MKKGMYYLLVVIFTAILFSCANQAENNSGKKADNANAGGAMAQTDQTQPVQTQQQAANTQGQQDQTVQQQAAQTQSQSQQAGNQTDNKKQVQQNNPSQNQPATSKQDPPKQQQQPVQQPNKPAASNPQSQDPIPQEIQQSLPQMVDEQGRPMKTTITRVPEDQRKPFIPKDKQKLTDNEIQLGNAVGNDLGEFYGYGVDSSQIKLSDLRGRLVMVVLWNSLCDHCVHDLDKYLPIYNNYHGKSYTEGKSFEIFTIGLDKERATWVQALTDKNYPWKHNVYVLDSWKDPDIRFFGIKNLPGNFLINGDGIVLEKLFTPEQLPDLLEKYLKK
jgi:hypothetical protein